MQVSPKQSPRGFQGSAGYTPLLQEGTWDTVVGGRSRELNATSIALLQSLLRSLRISHWGLEVQIEPYIPLLLAKSKLLAAVLCNFFLSGLSASHCGTRTEVTLLSWSRDTATQQELRMSVSARKILSGLEAVRAQRTATEVTHFLPAS